jgi:hypothetical protein
VFNKSLDQHKGELARMKVGARRAEEYLAKTGDIRAGLEVLKIEISKMERKAK